VVVDRDHDEITGDLPVSGELVDEHPRHVLQAVPAVRPVCSRDTEP
jgi:hypothetical protein